jgi:hypothetical protein
MKSNDVKPDTPGVPRDPLIPIALALLLIVSALYWQVGGYPFVNLDDNQYVWGNPRVTGGFTLESLSWAFTAFHESNWHPVTWLSHMLDVSLFGLDAGWHHRMNVFLHLLNTELLFFLLWRLTGGVWQSAFVAALFGVHPLHVESVAWVAERKDVLSTFFLLLTVWSYVRYCERPGWRRYLPVIVLFALGLMSKPMLVTLPFLLLLLDVWPLARHASLARRIREKAPLFALSAVSCIVTWLAQAGGGAVSDLEGIPPVLRIGNALVSCVAYLLKLFLPSPLAIYYPHPATVPSGLPAWQVAGALLVLSGITGLAIRQRQRRPYLAVGWFWYLGTLVPVIGLVQVGAQSMADRYTYIPLTGLFIMLAWGISDLALRFRIRKALLGGGATLALAALLAVSWVQVGYWRNTAALFEHAISAVPDNWIALHALGKERFREGRIRDAIVLLREAVTINPRYAIGQFNLGTILAQNGLLDDAVVHLEAAVRVRPDYAQAHQNLGAIFSKMGRVEEAELHYNIARRYPAGVMR